MFEKITVLMSTYKHAKFLPPSLDSVLNQTFSDFEFIIINDGSPDNSADILREYAKKDDRILVANHQSNNGRGWCRNALLGMAQTPVVTWMDSDDLMYPTRLQKQVDYMKSHPECKFLGTEMDSLMPDGSIVPGCHVASDYDKVIPENLHNWNPIANPTVMFNKKIVVDLGGYREDMKELEDLDLWKRLYESGERVYCLPERLHLYRIGTHSV